MKSLRQNVLGKSGSANQLDVEVGHQLKQRRMLMGLSQSTLAERVDVTFQQIQKYEKGINRISASKLYELSIVLDVPVSFFFSSCNLAEEDDAKSKHDISVADVPIVDLMRKRETLDLLRIYYSINNKKIRKDFFKFIETLAQSYKS